MSSSRSLKTIHEKRAVLVDLVHESHELLFGSFDYSNYITKEKKRERWVQIMDIMVGMDMSLVPEGKTWTYIRDTGETLLTASKERLKRRKELEQELKIKDVLAE